MLLVTGVWVHSPCEVLVHLLQDLLLQRTGRGGEEEGGEGRGREEGREGEGRREGKRKEGMGRQGGGRLMGGWC